MKIQLSKFTVEMQEGQSCILTRTEEKCGITEYEFQFSWTDTNAEADDAFTITWSEPCNGMMYKWDATCNMHRSVYVHWDDTFNSMISVNAPVSCYFDGSDTNRYCWALSECKKLVQIKNAFDDLNGFLTPSFILKTSQFTEQFSTSVTLRIDKRPVSMGNAVADIAAWWSNDLGITPAYVPDDAREPLYSFWYSHHQQVNAPAVEEECSRAKELGFEICIVDDGWQTEDSNGAYGYCGDWQPAPGKFPDMAAHVRRVHEIGMKYILWYSVPFIGHYSQNYDHFRGMLLRDDPELHCSVLDPRYREVREFLISTYTTALKEWDLDGFKLDFIDVWKPSPDNALYNEDMDIPALQDAVDICMTEIMEQLSAIKPDIMLEFRQCYIGPHMKHFGNMFRVGDCAANYLKNRSSILDLRMMMGDQAVHSDMLMLAPSEVPEINAIQIISCMFGVLQYSGKLNEQSSDALEMSRFWLSFLKTHKELLLCSKLEAYEAHLLYTWAKATSDTECAVGVYAIDKCIQPDPADTIYIANGCMGKRILMELTGTYQVQILDCRGYEQVFFTKDFSGISSLPVPVGGLAVLHRYAE